MNSIAPAFLVAVPQLQDPNFERTVTLLLEANSEGAFGLVLNRISPITVAEVCAQNGMSCARELYVRIGGPCEQERAWVLHGPNVHAKETFAVTTDIFMTPTWEMLAKLAQGDPNEPFQVYLGFAGWGPGQLEREVAEGTWLLTDVSPELVFDASETDIWRAVLHKMGLDPGKIAPGGGGLN